jgi:hypothetical protein
MSEWDAFPSAETQDDWSAFPPAGSANLPGALESAKATTRGLVTGAASGAWNFIKGIPGGLKETAQDVGLPWEHELFTGHPNTDIASQMARGEVGGLEGAGRVANVALAGLPASPIRAATRAVEPAAASKIADAATVTYDATKDAARNVKLFDPEAIHARILWEMEQLKAPSEIVARPVYTELEGLTKAKNASQLIEMRKIMGPGRGYTGAPGWVGEQRQAAKIARQALDREIDQLVAPGTSEALARADKNYAIALQVPKAEALFEGGATKKQIDAFQTKRAAYASPEELKAVERYRHPGFRARLAQGVGQLDPLRGDIGHIIANAVTHGPAAALTGGWSLPVTGGAGFIAHRLANRGLANRAAAISAAIRAQAPAGGGTARIPAQWGTLVPPTMASSTFLPTTTRNQY